MRKNGDVKKCLFCGKEFYVRHSRVGKFCSKKCQGKHTTQVALERIEMDQAKNCMDCHKRKSLSEFSKDASRFDGLSVRCRECASNMRKTYRASENGRKITKNDNLKRKFGITIDDYNALFERQGGVCAICGEEEKVMANGELRALSVDHNHETGEVRGLLCNGCNRGIGLFRDNITTLKNAARYLDRDSFVEAA